MRLHQAGAVMALAIALLCPAIAHATAIGRAEWVLPGGSGLVNQPVRVFGTGEDISATGTPYLTAAAPSFGGPSSGFVRVSVSSGAMVCSTGDTPVATETNGVWIGAGSPPQFLPVVTGQKLSCIQATNAPVTSGSGGPYALLTNASATGAPVAGILGGSYIWSCTGTFGGATLTLKTLGPDGATYVTVATMTSATNTGVAIGGNATAEVVVTGGPPSAIYCSLS